MEIREAITEVLEEVATERIRQDAIWGDRNPLYQDAMSAMTVLMEEVGEMAKAALEEKFDDLRAEAIQVAAVAVAIAERLSATTGVMSWRCRWRQGNETSGRLARQAWRRTRWRSIGRLLDGGRPLATTP